MKISYANIVVPVFKNRDTLCELYEQVSEALFGTGIEPRFVFVDDACPESSTDVLGGPNIKILRLDVNCGQQAAIRAGLNACEDGPVVVMDADLQDPPDVLPMLLSQLREQNGGAVFATRIGQYQGFVRRFTASSFRTVMRALVPLPKGAGGFVVFANDVAQRLRDSKNPNFYLAGLIGCHASKIGALPVQRRFRASGKSAYSGSMRIATGISNIKCVLHERSKHAKR